MLNYKCVHFIALCTIALTVSMSCQKVEKGYLSDNIYYLQNPFTVQQGTTATSGTIVGDGSTSPLSVKLLAVRNELTGENADSMLLKKDTILVYKDAVTYQDSTLALLNAKLKDSAVAPFSVNPLGGRLQFTQASQFVDTGVYTIDVTVSNMRGTKTLNNACNLVITPLSTQDSLFYKSVTASNAAEVFSSLPSNTLTVTIVRYPAGPNKIVLKWLDKNGTAFDPAAGEIVARTGRPTFKDWNPYYPEVKTDTSIEYQYPAGIPQIPAYASTVISNGSSWGGGICYYRIALAHTDIQMAINTVSTILYYVTQGTYIVTYSLNNIVRVP